LGQIGGPTQHGISKENASELVRLWTLQIRPALHGNLHFYNGR
jgi:hypothetical protein